MSLKLVTVALTMRGIASLSTGAVVLGSGVMLPGCGLIAASGPSSVAQGLRYEANEPNFDQFFAAMHATQVEFGEGPDTWTRAREELAHRVDAPPDADLAKLKEKLQAALAEASKQGVTFKLQMSNLAEDAKGKPSAKLIRTGTLDRKAEKLAGAIEALADIAAKLSVSMPAAVPTAKKLRVRATELNGQVDTVFRKEGIGKKNEVHKNLDDALKLIPLVLDRAETLGRDAEEMVDMLEETVGATPAMASPSSDGVIVREETPGTGAPGGPKHIVLEEDPSDTSGRRHAPRGKPAAAPAPAPAPKPAPAAPKPASAAPADDFEP